MNLFDGMNVYKPFTKLFTWIPMIRRRMDYIAVLEKYFQNGIYFLFEKELKIKKISISKN